MERQVARVEDFTRSAVGGGFHIAKDFHRFAGYGHHEHDIEYRIVGKLAFAINEKHSHNDDYGNTQPNKMF
jgi:hypothetical protein